MMLSLAIYALLAPTMVYAAAFEWSLPEPTFFPPAADNWSPAPTAAPHFPGLELLRRQQGLGDNTCAFLSRSSESSITCFNTNFICATNSQFGVNGCCDPASIKSCIIPTQCVASTAMSLSCTDAACSSNPAIVKCTQYEATECYRWLIEYSTTIMVQHGCTDKGFTRTVQRSWNMQSSVAPELWKTATVTVHATPSGSPTLIPSDSSKPGIGVIVGGTIGGCIFLSIIALVIFLVYRKRKIQRDATAHQPVTQFHGHGGMTEYNPHGFPTVCLEDDHKAWQQHQHGPVHRADDTMPQYPGMVPGRLIVEVDGMQRPVEAPTDGIYHDHR